MLIVVWGHKVLFSAVKKVTFACSACGTDREGTLRRARRWFTIFFIPLFPTKELGHDVRCGTCKSRFAPRILEVRTTAQGMEELGDATRHGAAAMVRAGSNSPARRDAAVKLIRTLVDTYDDDTLDRDLVSGSNEQFDAWLCRLSSLLNPIGKERFYTAMAEIAIADGALEGPDREMLERIGQGLLLTPAQLHGLRAITEQSTP